MNAFSQSGTTFSVTTDLLLAVVSGLATPDETAEVYAAALNDRELRMRLALMLPPPDEEGQIAEAVAGKDGAERD
jgi:hypothetical protein